MSLTTLLLAYLESRLRFLLLLLILVQQGRQHAGRLVLLRLLQQLPQPTLPLLKLLEMQGEESAAV